jgi:tetratricopeptide (TPR) repeat protein
MTTDKHDVLEHNVSTLLETGGERPQISDAARTRIRAALVAQHGQHGRHEGARGRARSPLVAVGLGLAAMAVAALVVGRFVAGDPPASLPVGALGALGSGAAVRAVAGAEIVGEPGAKVTELGPRRLRVEGAALIDVEPGKGAFVVETAHGRIEVLGTKFLVDGARDRTTAAVVRGEVKLATADGEVVLHAGEQAVAEPGHPPVRGPAPRLSHLVSWAQEARHRDEHVVEPLHHGTLFARDPGVRSHPPWGAEYPLPIVRLGLDVVVEDQVARVALDQTFHNPASQALEGVYRFAIPPDAALQRLAMYVDGKLMESAVVERMAARRIYEELVYRRVDPALLEWAGTGRLALRVYPIPALQDKRLMLAYTQSLAKLYDDWTLSIPLPEVDQPVGAMDVSVRVKGCANCELTSTSHPVAVAREGNDAIVTYHRAGAQIGDSFVIHVRDARKATTVARSERGGDRYLLVRAPGELAGGPRAYRPRTWVILDDVSASRSHLELRAQADVIDGFLRELDEQDRVAVVAFDVEARVKLARTRVLDVDRHAVRKALDPEGGVGATDVEVALDAALAQLAGVDPDDAMIVYLGDGVITNGARNLDALRQKLAGKAHFVGVGLGDGPDTQTLQGLAAATGGYATTMDLADDLGWRAFDLVAALHTSRVTGLDARLVDASGQLVPSATYLGSPQLADGEELELVARLAGSGTPAAVELTGTLNGAPWRRTIALGATGGAAAGYLPRLWAQRHIAARLLAKHEPVVMPPCSGAASVRGKPAAVCPTEAELREARDEAIRKDIVGLGKQYFLLSRHTSLLVLENDDMYTRYGVTKGAGETWAPYAMPRTIPVTAVAQPVMASNIADDAELVRAPLQVFYNTDGYLEDLGGAEGDFGVVQKEQRELHLARRRGLGGGDFGPMAISTVSAGPAMGATAQPTGSTRAHLRISADPEELAPLNKAIDRTASLPLTEKTEAKADAREAQRDPFHAGSGEDKAKARSVVVAGAGGLIGDLESSWIGAGKGRGASPWGYGQPAAARLGTPTDPAFDDVTAFVPALFPDAADRWRAELAAGDGKSGNAGNADPHGAPHAMDAAVKAVLAAARRALPTGIYRWGDLELAVDDARRIGWRRTTEAGLAETASFDGTTWTRRYAELGLDVTRAVADDDVALQLGHLPVWIAEPAHYARWFDVTLRGPREVVLSRRVRGQAEVVLVLAFDDRSRLVAITDAAGAKLVEVSWMAGMAGVAGAAGPTGARVLGDELAVGFTGQAVPDAARWAHGDATPRVVSGVVPGVAPGGVPGGVPGVVPGGVPGVVIDLPAHLPAYWQAKVAAEAAGSPAWRHAQRQRMVALAATQDRAGLWQAYDQLRTHGGVELGDLALASGGVASGTTDAQLAAAVAPLAHQPLARYLIAGRAFGKSPRPERLGAASRTGAPGLGGTSNDLGDGLVKALWSLRAVTAYARAGKGKPAADELVAMGDRAPALRLLGAATCGTQWELGAGDVARAWDAVATGPYRNVARAAAAQALFQRGKYDAGADRAAQLVADLDLAALPPRLDGMMYSFQQSRRGPAGWQMVWAMWRERVLAGTSYAHVMALLAASAQQGGEVMPMLARAAELAGDDPGKRLGLAQLAIGRGQGAWADALVRPLLKAQPSHDLYQLVASIALQQGRLGEALADLEAAQDAGAGDAVDLATVRGELAQIIELARRVAIASTGADRERAVARALAWGRRWRAVDEANPDIDQQLGEVMLAVGDRKAAWRQLSSTIERDPWSGAGYTTVAEAFERQGRIADALAFWQQAIVIDQTNPTPRLRKAQALIALGRAAEGDALLAEIAQRRWHDVWSGVAEQARELLERSSSR